MTADALQFYNAFKANIGNGSMDLDTNTFKLMLVTSTYTFAATHSQKSDITNELSTANGYTANGATLASVTWAQSSGTAKFDSNDPSWTASGGSLVFRRGVLYDDTSTNDLLVGSVLFDNTPANITVTDGNTFTVQVNASNGWFTLT